MICQMCLLSYSHLFFLGFIEMRNGMSCLLDGRASGPVFVLTVLQISIDWPWLAFKVHNLLVNYSKELTRALEQ